MSSRLFYNVLLLDIVVRMLIPIQLILTVPTSISLLMLVLIIPIILSLVLILSVIIAVLVLILVLVPVLLLLRGVVVSSLILVIVLIRCWRLEMILWELLITILHWSTIRVWRTWIRVAAITAVTLIYRPFHKATSHVRWWVFISIFLRWFRIKFLISKQPRFSAFSTSLLLIWLDNYIWCYLVEIEIMGFLFR